MTTPSLFDEQPTLPAELLPQPKLTTTWRPDPGAPVAASALLRDSFTYPLPRCPRCGDAEHLGHCDWTAQRCPACNHLRNLHSGEGATASTPGTCHDHPGCPCPGWRWWEIEPEPASLFDSPEHPAKIAAAERRAANAASIPDGPCARCGATMTTVGRVIDGRPYCVPCAACSNPWCAAWATEPGARCRTCTDTNAGAPTLAETADVHHCPTCDAFDAEYGDEPDDAGPPPGPDYTNPAAGWAYAAEWHPATCWGEIDGPHGPTSLHSVDTRDANAHGVRPGGGALWYRAWCACGWRGPAHTAERAAALDLADHAWPEWRNRGDEPADPPAPKKGEPALDLPADRLPVARWRLCDPSKPRLTMGKHAAHTLCRGVVPGRAEHGGRLVICSNPEHEDIAAARDLGERFRAMRDRWKAEHAARPVEPDDDQADENEPDDELPAVVEPEHALTLF